MMSNLISAMRDAIKSETELYTMRIQQQMNRYCSLIESAVVVNAGGVSGVRDNYQDQIDTLKVAVDSIVADLYKYKCSSVCSSDLDNEFDILPEPNWVVNKVKPEEIKEVHINLDEVECNRVVIETDVSSVGCSDSPREHVIVNEIVAQGHVHLPTSSAATVATSANNDEVVEDEHCIEEGNEEDDVIEEETEEVMEEDEIAEEEGEELELEEIEWKGVKYYNDSDGNVYECLEGGEVGESIGTMSKKVAGKVLLYATE